MLKVRVLQTPGIELDGQPVCLPFKRADALLYYMVVRRSASRQELIALLWEGDDEAKGLKNLRNALYTLKKALGGDVLVSPQKAMISLNPEWVVECDYDRFVLDGDLSAYQGPFLNGFGVKNAFALDEWIHRTREKLHTRYLRGMEEQAKRAYAERDYEEAVRWAGLCLAEDPYDETMAAFIMECLRETRQFARAVQVYQRLKELLSGELGVDPLETTTMLYYEILNRWNEQSKIPEERTVPVGRERVYESLRAAVSLFLETATRRGSQLLVGENGSGKSELINYFLRSGPPPSLLVVRSESLRSERQQPLAAWNRLTRSLAESVRKEEIVLPERAAELLQKETDVREEDALLLCAAIGTRKKLLLILEDVQWADSHSMLLLDAVLRHSERGSLMVVLTGTWSWPETTQRTLERLEADGLLRRQILMPLSLADTAEFLRRELGSEASGKWTERFYHETGGNLRLLVEAVRACAQNADVEETLHAMGETLLKRLDGLPENAVRVLEIVSLYENGITVGLLLEMMGTDDEKIGYVLRKLCRWSILEEFPFEEIRCFRVVHRRLRELVYERLTVPYRGRLHKMAAELLIQQELETNEAACAEITYHFRLAGETCRALDYRLRTLELESLRCCSPFRPGMSAKLPLRGPEALEQDTDDCLRMLAELRSAAEQRGDDFREMEQRAMLLRGRLALYRGDWEMGMELMGPLSSASVSRDKRLLAETCVLLADAAYFRQAADLAERYVNTGMRLLIGEREPVLLARLYRLRGSCFGLRGDYDRGGYYLYEALDLLEKQEPTPEVRCVMAAVYGDLGRSARCRNDFVHAGRWFKKAMSAVKDYDCAGQVWLYVHYGRTLFAVDDYMRAKDLFQEAYRIARERGELWGRTAAAAYCAYFQMSDGDHAQAARTLGEAIFAAEQTQSPLEQGILNFVCMRIRRRLDLEQREDSLLQALLTDTADDYARRGVRLCSGIPDVFEMQMLSRDLRDGISTQLRYRSSELYSKNKRFMSE